MILWFSGSWVGLLTDSITASQLMYYTLCTYTLYLCIQPCIQPCIVWILKGHFVINNQSLIAPLSSQRNYSCDRWVDEVSDISFFSYISASSRYLKHTFSFLNVRCEHTSCSIYTTKHPRIVHTYAIVMHLMNQLQTVESSGFLEI